MHSRYRPDIDGLRALAILPVLGFHAFPEFIKGGFIGVDVFFVISGFLISRIILENINNGKFSYAGFYARRIKRIFPALILVLLTAYALGWLILLPEERVYLGAQIAAGAGFFSNLMLWKSFGYFSPSIDKLPLMHLWSLSIEEQFYVVWPLLLWLLQKNRYSFIYLLSFVVLFSFIANVYSVYGTTTAAFYSPLSRLWELGSGGILAHLCLNSEQPSPTHANWRAGSGVFFLMTGMLLIDKEKYFPGWWVLLPVAGTLLLIAAGSNAWINRHLLGNRMLVTIGLISYPLYLWHWPLLSFARILEEATPSCTLRIIALGLAFTMAWLTWYCIEKPAQRQQGKRIIAVLVALMLSLLGAGIMMTRDALDTIAHQGNEMEFEQHWEGWQKCYNTQSCRILDASRPADIAVIGDSHAGHLANGLRDIVHGRQENIIAQQQSMCLPVYSIKLADETYFNCLGTKFIDQSLDDAINSPTIHTIILSGYANLFIHRYDENTPENPNLREVSSDQSGHANMKHVEILGKAIETTLEKLSRTNKKVIFLVDTPELDFDPRECVTLRKFTLPMHKPRTPCAVEKTRYDMWSAEYLQLVSQAEARFPSIRFIHTDKYFCDKQWCWAMIENQLMYSDRSHLTPTGSRYLMNKIKPDILE